MSGVVTTLVLILISLLAIGIIWVVVSSLLRNNSNDASIELSTLSTTMQISNAYESGTNITVIVQRKTGDANISKMTFILSNNTGATESIILPVVNGFNKYEHKTFVLTPIILNSTNTRLVEIIPLYDAGNGKTKDGGILAEYIVNHNFTGTGGTLPGEEGGEEECTPDCDSVVCGESDGCDGTCVGILGTCPEGLFCGLDGICSEVESCTPDCTNAICGASNGCEGICTGENGTCDVGNLCNSTGTCVEVIAINNGTVDQVWPADSGLYFASEDLPLEPQDLPTTYPGKYVKVTGNPSEVRCIPILLYRLNLTDFPYAHIGFNMVTNITVNDPYYIYDSYIECMATISV